ncbi:tetratricopeptide repeat protein [bacterium]|nr:tetratricopeptide repeat protein [bacterium]
MKKTLLIASILLVAVISTACINNLAVQDLNNKAKSYMEQGDYTQAIERLKSSLDLDSSVFETHYNLAIAYTGAEDYANAVEEYKKALSIRQDADVYYSLATAENNLSVDIQQGRVRINIDNNLYTPKADEISFDEKYQMSEKEKQLVEDLNNSAVQNYKKYLELNPNAKDKEDVDKLIEKLSNIEE